MNKERSLHINYLDAASEIAKTTKSRVADLIGHGGEKGKLVEGLVVELINRFLPKRFSIGSGLVTTSSGRVSSQNDIVIYDELYNSPIKIAHGISIFPIESVYATIEVKSTLDQKNFLIALQNNKTLRSFNTEKSYAQYSPVPVPTQPGTYQVNETTFPIPLPPRTYIVAFEAEWSTYEGLKERFRSLARDVDTHLHGLLVLEPDWFYWQIVQEHEVQGHKSNGTRAFVSSLIRNTASFPMMPAKMTNYLGAEPKE